MDFIDFYTQATPTPRAKQAPTPWEGPEGQRARARGVRTADEFAVFTVIAEASKSSRVDAHLSDGEIARRAKMSELYVGKIVQTLVLRGVVRAESGFLGVRSLIPSNAT